MCMRRVGYGHPSWRIIEAFFSLMRGPQDGTDDLTPGPFELQGRGCKHFFGRDKNLRLRWPAVADLLARIASLGRSSARYKELKDGRQVFFLLKKDRAESWNASHFQ